MDNIKNYLKRQETKTLKRMAIDLSINKHIPISDGSDFIDIKKEHIKLITDELSDRNKFLRESKKESEREIRISSYIKTLPIETVDDFIRSIMSSNVIRVMIKGNQETITYDDHIELLISRSNEIENQELNQYKDSFYKDQEKRILFLKKTHTKVLLSIMNYFRMGCRFYKTKDGLILSYDDVKTELKFRPHIPNKKEAKEIRKQKALSRRHQ